jgi:hypothetical protein
MTEQHPPVPPPDAPAADAQEVVPATQEVVSATRADTLNDISDSTSIETIMELIATAERTKALDTLTFLREGNARRQTTALVTNQTNDNNNRRRAKLDIKIDKFDGDAEKYADWAKAAAMWMQSQGLLRTINAAPDGTPLKTPRAADIDKDDEQAARIAICLQLTTQDVAAASGIMELKSAAEQWAFLAKRYNPSTMITVVRGVRELTLCRQRVGETVQVFAARLKSAVARVRSVAPARLIQISSDMVALLLIVGLRPEFSVAVAPINAKAIDETINLDDVISLALQEEQRIADVGDQAPAIESAYLVAQVAAMRIELDKRNANGRSTCSIPSHVHAGGDAACWSLHPELRPLNQRANRNTPTTTVYSRRVPLYSALSNPPADDDIIADSGAGRHIIHDPAKFTTLDNKPGPMIETAHKGAPHVATTGTGTVRFAMGTLQVQANDALEAKLLGRSVFSIGQSAASGIKYLFDGHDLVVYAEAGFIRPAGSILATVPRSADNLYRLNGPGVTNPAPETPKRAEAPTPTLACAAAPKLKPKGQAAKRKRCNKGKVQPISEQLAHERTGHLHKRALRCLAKHAATGLSITPGTECKGLCEACILAKMTRRPFKSSSSRTTRVGELILSDIKGPMPITGLGGARYFVTFTDHHTRFLVVYVLKTKCQWLDALKGYEAMLLSRHDARVNAIEEIQTDNAGEMTSGASGAYLSSRGITHRLVVAGDSESNGIAERVNRTIMDITNAMLLHSQVPPSFWTHAVRHSAFLINRRPSSFLGGKRTPFRPFTGRHPDLRDLRVFGCDAWALTPIHTRKALQPHSRRAVFIGFAQGRKAWRMYDTKTKKEFFSRDVTFDEKSFTFMNQVARNPAEARPAERHHGSVELQVNHDQEVREEPQANDDQEVREQLGQGAHRQPAVAHENEFAALRPDDDDDAVDEDDEDAAPDDEDGDAEDPGRRHSTRERAPIDRFSPCHSAVTVNRADERWSSTVDRWSSTPRPYTADAMPNDKGTISRLAHEQRVADERLLRSTALKGGASILAAEARAIHLADQDVADGRRPLATPLRTEGLLYPDMSTFFARDLPVFDSIKAALAGPYSGWCHDAYMEEMTNHDNNGTFGPPTKLPTGARALGFKYIFEPRKLKDSSGLFTKYKGRIVAKGYAQVEGVDFNETFASTASSTSINVVLAVAAQYGWRLRQYDHVAAYLNGIMEHIVHMRLPDGSVRRLIKAIYGTRQGAERWQAAHVEMMKKLGWVRTIADPCVFTHTTGETTAIVAIHSDDGLMACSDNDYMLSRIAEMNAIYPLVDQGAPSRLLGMRVRREGETGPIHVDQSEYIGEILAKFNMTDCKPEPTPHQPGLYMTADMSPKTEAERAAMRDTPFLSLLCSLLWLACRCRPDIDMAVNALLRFMSDPGQRHWTAAKRIVRYLAGTRYHGVRYAPQPTGDFQTWADADWAGDPDTRRSRTGSVITLAGGAIWSTSRLQQLGAIKVSLSSTHAEIKALCAATRQVVWLRLLLEEIGFPQTGPSIIYEDNRGARLWAGYRRMDKRTKDIEVQFHYTREAVVSGLIRIDVCPTLEMRADFLTKPCTTSVFKFCKAAIGVADTESYPLLA